MAETHQHREKAEHHENFLGMISDDFPDWLATVAFYAAVEWIESLFATRDLHSRSHEDRNQAVLRNFRSIHKAYKALYNASLDARYQSKDHWVPACQVRADLINVKLAHIRAFVISHGTKAA